MKAEHAIKFLHALGAKDPSEVSGWVTCSCVLAPFTHKNGKDSTPSFGIKLDSGNFNCYACSKGSLEKLFGELQMHLSRHPEHAHRYNLKLAREILDGIVSSVEPLPEYVEFTDHGTQFQEWSEYYLDQFSHPTKVPEAMEYLASRGLYLPEVEHFDLRVDQMRGHIVCPFRNAFGKLAGARGRAYSPNAKLKHFDHTWNKTNNSGLVLFHEDCLMAYDGRPVIVVEGQFDAMAVWKHYPFPVANLTAKPTPQKLKRLRNCELVLIFLDNDATGEEMRDVWVRGLRDHTMVGIIEYPKEIRLDPVFKDPNSLPTKILAGMLSEVAEV